LHHGRKKCTLYKEMLFKNFSYRAIVKEKNFEKEKRKDHLLKT